MKEGKTLEVDGVTYALYEDASDAAMKVKSYTDDATNKYFTNMDDFTTAIKAAANKAGQGDIKTLTVDADGTVNVTAFADLNNSLDLSLHVGADSTKDNKIGMSINMMSARGLGVNGLDVSGADYTNATNAIDTITDAIQKVSTQRSALGAIQNRLEHTINNLDNVVENTTSAESAIRDTDMATEMVRYSNNNILAQAGQAMLAQANQSNQGVLSLLG
jgi:flagellin